MLRDCFEKISTKTWCAFPRASAEKRTGHAAIDSTGFDRDHPSRYYAYRAHSLVRSLKATALVDVETLYVTDVHCTTTKKHDAKIGPQVARRNAGDLLSLAADRGYDGNPVRDELHGCGVRPPTKHRIYSSLDLAHTVRMSSTQYNRRWMVETVFSRLKRALGATVCARSWHGTPRNGSQMHRLQPPSEREITVNSSAVYRSYRALKTSPTNLVLLREHWRSQKPIFHYITMIVMVWQSTTQSPTNTVG